MKFFVTELIDLFNIGSDGIRIGVVAFATDVTIVFQLDYSFNALDIKIKIININNSGGLTYTGWY